MLRANDCDLDRDWHCRAFAGILWVVAGKAALVGSCCWCRIFGWWLTLLLVSFTLKAVTFQAQLLLLLEKVVSLSTSFPESKMRESMARYSRGARGSSVIPDSGASGTSGEGGGTAVAAPIDVRYTVERINSVDYVTADQFQRGMQQAAIKVLNRVSSKH